MKLNKLATLLVLSAGATLSQAQFAQEYDKDLGSFASVVKNFANPRPEPEACADDFAFADDYVVNHFKWWGTVSNPLQLARPYYIAIYLDNGCRPGAKVYETAAIPTTAVFAKDCTGATVYSFLVTLGAPLNIPAGHYWFRVAEMDDNSFAVGAVDFQWSGKRPRWGCRAGYHTWAPLTWNRPLIDPCDGLEDDLAFCVLG